MKGRILALDVGEKRIGVAVSDALGITAQGLPVIEMKPAEKAIESIKELCVKYDLQKIVIGLPKNMNGTLGFKSIEVTRFSELLGKKISITIIMWDERLTTKMAQRSLLEGDLSRVKRKKRVDTIAAQLILQSYLDSIGNEHEKQAGDQN